MRDYACMLAASVMVVVYMAGCTTMSREDVKPSRVTGETRIYEVFGMGCPGCHSGLTKLVKKIDGVKNAEANWKKKQLTVILLQGAKLNDKDVFDAMKRGNFTPGKRIQ